MDDGGFTDGAWEGEVISTVILTEAGGGRAESDPLGAPFRLTVTDGKVEGTYGVAMYQTLMAEGLEAEGVGTLAGAVTGCWFAPRLLPDTFEFSGTVTNEHGTFPFEFSQPLGEAAPVTVAASWHFDEGAREGSRTGMLDSRPFLEYMRSVGVEVNEVTIDFVADRVG